jgi:mannose-6-phosphate isomerase
MTVTPVFQGDMSRAVSHIVKPWGYELIYALTENYCGKVLFVRAGACLSLQYHRLKDETIYLQDGDAVIELGTDDGNTRVLAIAPGASFHVPPGTVHRLRARTDSTFLEVSTPHLDDVVRIEDRYGRAN